MEKYCDVFTRSWYRIENGCKVAGVGPRRYLAHHVTEADARELCREYNRTHEPGWLSVKAEYEEV